MVLYTDRPEQFTRNANQIRQHVLFYFCLRPSTFDMASMKRRCSGERPQRRDRPKFSRASFNFRRVYQSTSESRAAIV